MRPYNLTILIPLQACFNHMSYFMQKGQSSSRSPTVTSETSRAKKCALMVYFDPLPLAIAGGAINDNRNPTRHLDTDIFPSRACRIKKAGLGSKSVRNGKGRSSVYMFHGFNFIFGRLYCCDLDQSKEFGAFILRTQNLFNVVQGFVNSIGIPVRRG